MVLQLDEGVLLFEMIDWKKYFDHIYCIQFLPKHEERYPRICGELARVGILESGIFSWKYTVDNQLYKILLQNIVEYEHKAIKEEFGMLACAIAHYEVYKAAHYMNYKRILVLEEDIMFLKNINAIQIIINNIPDTDIVLFDKFVYSSQQYINCLKDRLYDCNKYYKYFDKNSTKFGSAACYSLNKKAYDIFIQLQERRLYNPDEIWNNWSNNIEANELTKSYAIINLGYLKDFAGSMHGIKNNELAYKFIGLNKELYM